jgi:hypothetical protein
MANIEWKQAQLLRPLFAFGSSLLQIGDTSNLIFVKPWYGPYGICPDFFQTQEGWIIHKDNLQFLP